MMPSPLRKLALRLACMDAESRAWILAQLDPAELERINALLAEIDALGLLQDDSVLEAILSEPDAPVAGEGKAQDAEAKILTVVRSPVWAGLQLSYLEGKAPEAVCREDRAALQHWQRFWAGHEVPPAWRAMLEAHALERNVVHE